MATEGGTYISDLDATKPASGETPGEGDDHLRLIKSLIKASFPGVTGAVTPTHTELNVLNDLASGKIILGNSSNVAAAVTPSGDVTITDAGVTAIASGVIVNADINASAAIDATKIANGTVTSAEFQYLGDVTGLIQAQLDLKSPLASPTFTGTVTIPNYTETLYAPSAGSSFTVDLANGTVQKFTSNNHLTITLPASASGKSYVIIVAYGGSHSLTINGGSTIKWSGGAAPTATSTNGKFDIFSFFCDGTNTYAQAVGLNY